MEKQLRKNVAWMFAHEVITLFTGLIVAIFFLGTVVPGIYPHISPSMKNLETPAPASPDIHNLPKESYGVKDLAGVLTGSEKSDLEDYISSVSYNSTIEIGVLIVNDTGGASMLEYTTEVFEANKLGNENDTGLLMVISKNDRKYFIETGYGLESCLPDGKIGKISRENLLYPILDDYSGGSTGGGGVENSMKASGYGRAITDTLTQLVKQCDASEFYKNPVPLDSMTSVSRTALTILPIVIVLSVLAMAMAMISPHY